MRHGDKVNNLGRKSAHRKALLRNLTCQLIEHKGITTTVAKAKALRVFAEPLINRSKVDNTNNRRVVFSYLQNKEAIKELFGVIGDKVSARPGGYTRIIKLPRRMGDNAELAYIELVDFNVIYNPKDDAGAEKKKTRRSRRSAGTAKTAAPKAAAASNTDASSTLSSEAPAVDEVAEALEPVMSPVENKPGNVMYDDLTIVEGIGPKVAELLNEAGITTFAQLASKTKAELEEFLDAAGGVYKTMDPTTWPQQAQLANEGKIDELNALKDQLNGGKA